MGKVLCVFCVFCTGFSGVDFQGIVCGVDSFGVVCYCVCSERGGFSGYCVWGDRGGVSVYCEWWVTGVEIHVIVCSKAEVEIQGIVFAETSVCFMVNFLGSEGWNFGLLFVG